MVFSCIYIWFLFAVLYLILTKGFTPRSVNSLCRGNILWIVAPQWVYFLPVCSSTNSRMAQIPQLLCRLMCLSSTRHALNTVRKQPDQTSHIHYTGSIELKADKHMADTVWRSPVLNAIICIYSRLQTKSLNVLWNFQLGIVQHYDFKTRWRLTEYCHCQLHPFTKKKGS